MMADQTKNPPEAALARSSGGFKEIASETLVISLTASTCESVVPEKSNAPLGAAQRESVPNVLQPVIIASGKLRRKEASAYLLARHGISRTPSYLAFLASQGGGPLYRKINGCRVVYDTADLDAWASSLLSEPVASTSEYRAVSGG